MRLGADPPDLCLPLGKGRWRFWNFLDPLSKLEGCFNSSLGASTVLGWLGWLLSRPNRSGKFGGQLGSLGSWGWGCGWTHPCSGVTPTVLGMKLYSGVINPLLGLPNPCMCPQVGCCPRLQCWLLSWV